MIQTVALALGGLIALLLLIAALKPPRFRVHRSTLVQAPPERIYPHLADFRKWRGWSPWEELDPDLKRAYEGAEAGKGAIYRWDGNKHAGAGRMEIVAATPPHRLTTLLDFTRPFEAHNTTEFDLAPQGDATEVHWVMHGPQPFFFRVFTLFMSMDKLVGRDFEKGLARLKALVEGASAATPAAR